MSEQEGPFFVVLFYHFEFMFTGSVVVQERMKERQNERCGERDIPNNHHTSFRVTTHYDSQVYSFNQDGDSNNSFLLPLHLFFD